VPEVSIELNAQNSKEVADPQGRFVLRLPNDFKFTPEQELETARLYRIQDANEGDRTRMFFEENKTSIQQAMSLLLQEEGVKELRRETIAINELSGIKLTVRLSHSPDREVPYYFLQAGDYAYVFSLVGGTPFDYFVPIIESFHLAQ
jgi:hypothetical protein